MGDTLASLRVALVVAAIEDETAAIEFVVEDAGALVAVAVDAGGGPGAAARAGNAFGVQQGGDPARAETIGIELEDPADDVGMFGVDLAQPPDGLAVGADAVGGDIAIAEAAAGPAFPDAADLPAPGFVRRIVSRWVWFMTPLKPMCMASMLPSSRVIRWTLRYLRRRKMSAMSAASRLRRSRASTQMVSKAPVAASRRRLASPGRWCRLAPGGSGVGVLDDDGAALLADMFAAEVELILDRAGILERGRKAGVEGVMGHRSGPGSRGRWGS